MHPILNFFPELMGRVIEPFIYSMSWEPIAAGVTTVDANFQVDTGADFIVVAISHHAATEADMLTDSPYTPFLIQIRDTTARSGNWFDKAVPLGTVSARGNGNAAVPGREPQRLIAPRLVKAGGTVVASLTNKDTAEDHAVWVTFHGIKVYR
jgi:hypothetical protein